MFLTLIFVLLFLNSYRGVDEDNIQGDLITSTPRFIDDFVFISFICCFWPLMSLFFAIFAMFFLYFFYYENSRRDDLE